MCMTVNHDEDLLLVMAHLVFESNVARTDVLIILLKNLVHV